jgi:hypothetical protein
MDLSEAAKTALIDAGTNRVGAKVPDVSMGTWVELKASGVIGVSGGLTNKGSVVRERLMDEKLREAFGE